MDERWGRPDSEAILAGAHDALFTLDPDGVITSFSPSAERLYARTEADACGSPVAVLEGAESEGTLARLAQEVADGRVIETRHGTHRCEDGSEFSVSYSVGRLPGPDHGVVVIARDVSARDAVERELERTRLELERSNGDLERFAYVASHDLSEPLRAVTGFVQLLEQDYGDQLDDEGRRYIGRAVEASARMRRLIEDLLDYSRLDRHPAATEPVDCGALVRDVLADLEQPLAQHAGEVEVADLPVVVGDRGQLARLFQNLLGNAVKFAGDAPLHIAVSGGPDEAGWLFVVADNGIGIEPRYAERIFEVFKRLHSRRAYEGTGIGLAICKRIVENHGGRIWVEPTAGGGSTFCFTLSPVPGGAT